jgi:hypothetical protein
MKEAETAFSLVEIVYIRGLVCSREIVGTVFVDDECAFDVYILLLLHICKRSLSYVENGV